MSVAAPLQKAAVNVAEAIAAGIASGRTGKSLELRIDVAVAERELQARRQLRRELQVESLALGPGRVGDPPRSVRTLIIA